MSDEHGASHTELDPEAALKILEERSRILARTTTRDVLAADDVNLIEFSLGSERYGLEITMVHEVQPLTEGSWSRVPCTPDFIVGAVNIRGQIHSLMDVARFCGLPARPLTDNAHVLLVRSADDDDSEAMELCILSDDLPEVTSVSRADLKPAPGVVASRAQEYVHGVTADMLIVLNLERLLQDPLIIVHEEA